jgi:arylsulfatase A-like enzyme
VLSVTPPHDPFEAPERNGRFDPDRLQLRRNVPPVSRVEQTARKQLAGYYAQIENLDDNVGKIVSMIDEMDCWDETLLLVVSDHGDCMGSHGYFRKSSPWKEAVQIPCLVAGAGIAPGTVSDAPLNSPDLAPTTLGLCGLPVPDWMAGQDLSAWTPESPRQSSLLQQVSAKSFQCLSGTWRGLRRNDGWKYVVHEGHPWLLVNLAEDPYELANLAFQPEYADRRRELHDQLQRELQAVGDAYPMAPRDAVIAV